MIKIWHDDVRPAPEGWLWCKTNLEVMSALVWYDREVEEISLDHDLGAIVPEGMDPDEALLLKGSAEETGYKLVVWMIEHNFVPPSVTIHSWNGVGARRMVEALCGEDHEVTWVPFDKKRYDEWYDAAKDVPTNA